MEMERQNKKMQVWNLLAEKIRKLVEESVSNPEELQEIRIRTGQPLLIQMKGQERVLPDPAHPYLVTKEDIGETMGYICHYSLYAYENELKQGFITSVMADYSFEQVVDFASENGFECLEVACWPKGKAERKYAGVTHIDVSTLDSFKAEEILRYCKDRKVTISALAYYPNVLDEDDECRKKSIDHLMQVINAAAELKVNMVTTFIGRNQNLNVSDNLALAEKIWKPILNYAENRGVKIAIENCPMLFTEDEWPGGKNLAISPAIWRELFKRLPSDMLGLNFDPSHFIWQEMDYIKPLYEFKDKIFHVHYKDIKVNKDARNDVGILATPLSYMLPCIPGHGDVDWSEYIRVLLETGYKGAACIEIEDKSFENDKESIENSLKISRQYLKQFINFPEKGKKYEED